MISPTIFPLLRNAPSHDLFFSGEGGGSIMAIGSPRRVTTIGCRVRLTLSNTERQVALNREMVISSYPWVLIITSLSICRTTMVNDHGQIFSPPTRFCSFEAPRTRRKQCELFICRLSQRQMKKQLLLCALCVSSERSERAVNGSIFA